MTQTFPMRSLRWNRSDHSGSKQINLCKYHPLDQEIYEGKLETKKLWKPTPIRPTLKEISNVAV
jgi:hypothetical protein